MLDIERYSFIFLHYKTPLFKLYIILRSLGTPQLCFYLLKPNQVIVLMKFMRVMQVRRSTVKTLSFRTAHPDKQ